MIPYYFTLLYNIQSEPLAEYLHKTQEIAGIEIMNEENGIEREIRVCQYVDDTVIFLKNQNMIQKCLEIVDDFGLASGSKLNREKTVGIVLNNTVTHDCEVNFTKGSEKVLGIPIGKQANFDEFWNKLLQKQKSKLDMWQRWDLSIQGKIRISKSLGILTLLYAIEMKEISVWEVCKMCSICLIHCQ